MNEDTSTVKQGLSSLKRKLKKSSSTSQQLSPQENEETVEISNPTDTTSISVPAEYGEDSNMYAAAVQRESLIWKCNECHHECIPIRRESRCLCGHRLKEHKSSGENGYKCSSRGCMCSHFFFVVAEGAWVLKCRCKHKHIDHHCHGEYKCKKCTSCEGFDSPWVCNCGHAWSNHSQLVVTRGADDAQLQDVFTSAGKAFAVRQDGLLKGEF